MKEVVSVHDMNAVNNFYSSLPEVKDKKVSLLFLVLYSIFRIFGRLTHILGLYILYGTTLMDEGIVTHE